MPQQFQSQQQQPRPTSGPLRGAIHTGRSVLYLALASAGAVAASAGAAVVCPPLSIPLLCVPMVIYPAWYGRRERTAYLRQLRAQSQRYPGETGHPYRGHMVARRQQAEAAARDRSPFLRYGTALGILSENLDGFAPDAGMPFGQTAFDLSQHLLVIGKSGTGKTASFLRPLLWQWVNHRCGGLLVLDGKGVLAAEMRGLPGFKMIEPGVEVGLLEGLSPEDVKQAISSVGEHFGNGGEKSAFFNSEGGTMLFHGTVLLRALCDAGVPEYHYTLHGIYSLLIKLNSDVKDFGTTLVDLLAAYHPETEGDSMLIKDALTYACSTIVSMSSETRSNIWATVQSWISPVFQNKDLVKWSHTEHGIDITSIDNGGLFGINLPEVKYHQAGTVIQSLLKERVFNVIRARFGNVNGRPPIAIVVDEAQELVGRADAEFLPQARQMGGIGVYASQSIDAFFARIGNPEKAKAFLEAFSSQAILRSSKATIEWMSSQLGMTERRHWKGNGAAIGYMDSLRHFAVDAESAASHEGADVYRKLKRQGAGQFKLDGSFGRSLGHIGDLHIDATTNVEFLPGPLVEPHEADIQLATKGVALVQVQRGGHRRRDFVRLNHMDNFSEASLKAWEAAYAGTPS